LAANVREFSAVCATILDGTQIGDRLVMQKGMLLELKIAFRSVVVVLMLSILLSVLVGTVAGVLSRKPDIALALGSGMFAIIPIIEAAVLWNMRR
jgi:hypothetical protein